MRWLRGGNLKELLQNNPLDLASVVKLFSQIASGLTAAHRKDIVHRNLKPSNILLDEEGNAYLADFSIARDLNLPAGGLEELGAMVGSPVYLSPEQISGELVSPQSDIYSSGVLLYEMLNGAHPFVGLTPVEQCNRNRNDRLPPIKNLPSDVQEGVNAVIQKATEKTPRHRYRDVLEMVAALNQAASLAERETETTSAGQLTLREVEILGLIVAGYSNKQIAQELFVELSTVKWHITQIYNKLHVRTRYQAILRARECTISRTGASGR
jgi:serine/threonine protein kinase